MQRNVEFRSAFQVVPALKRRLLAEPSASPRLRFLGSRHEKSGQSRWPARLSKSGATRATSPSGIRRNDGSVGGNAILEQLAADIVPILPHNRPGP